MFGNQSAHKIAKIRTQGIAGPGRFKPENIAAGSRNANRPATVVAMGHGHHARCNRCSGSATGASRGVVGIPGVAARTEEQWLGGRKDTEFRRIGLADDDQAGPFVPGHQFAVVIRHKALQQLRSQCHPDPRK